MKIAYLVGSLSESSLNRALSKALVSVAPEGVELVEVEIKDLPLYNRDFDGNFPQVAADFKAAVAEADGVIFITPEHNRMFSAALHNAIEWTSRPYGEWALAGKPVATIGTSPSGIGTAAGQQPLRAMVQFFGVKLMGQPEGYIDATKSGIEADGTFTNESTKEFLAGWVGAFAQFVENNK